MSWKYNPFTDEFDYYESGELKGKIVSIELVDWQLSGELYYCDVVHNLDASYPNIQVRENNEVVHVHRIQTIDNNTVRLWVTVDPDLRFTGQITVLKA